MNSPSSQWRIEARWREVYTARWAHEAFGNRPTGFPRESGAAAAENHQWSGANLHAHRRRSAGRTTARTAARAWRGRAVRCRARRAVVAHGHRGQQRARCRPRPHRPLRRRVRASGGAGDRSRRRARRRPGKGRGACDRRRAGPAVAVAGSAQARRARLAAGGPRLSAAAARGAAVRSLRRACISTARTACSPRTSYFAARLRRPRSIRGRSSRRRSRAMPQR